MSSFRIDRQYVYFEPAETQPVRAKPKADAPCAPDGGDAAGVDMAKLYNEIYEKLRAEHAEQAEKMLSKASEEAQEIILKAKSQAEEIRAQAEAEAERLREEIKTAAEAEAERRRLRDEEALAALESGLRNEYDKLVEGMRDEVVSLVMEIVRKVINVKIEQSDEVFMGLVENALERLKQAGSVVIRVSSEDYQRYFGASRADIGIDAGAVKVTVAEEPGFSPGDLVVESEGELVDLSIDRQLDVIDKALRS